MARKRTLIVLSHILLMGIFVYAGLAKVRDPVAFTAEVAGFRLVDKGTSELVALILPWLEICAGVAVLFSPLRTGALAILCALSLVFSLALTSAMVRGLDISCGCFGSGKPGSLPWSLARAVALLGIAIPSLLVQRKNSVHRLQNHM